MGGNDDLKEVRHMAQEAFNRVSIHEKECAIRYEGILQRLDLLCSRISQGVYSVIAVMLAIISYLLTKYVV